LSDPGQARQFAKDILAVVNHPYYNWELDLGDAMQHPRPHRFLDIFDMFYTEKRRSTGKARFVCKENRLFEFAFALLQYYDRPKFIYLHRDPRDYAASFMDTPTGPKTAYAAALLWKREQEQCLALSHTFALPYHRLSYEGLLADPQGTISAVLEFLGEPVEPACFQISPEKNRPLAWNLYWQNLSKPILRDNAGKYRAKFSLRTIEMIETITGDAGAALGYRRTTRMAWKEPPFFMLRNYLWGWVRRLLLRKRHAKTVRMLESRDALIRSLRTKQRQKWRRKGTQPGKIEAGSTIHPST
jgi:hypothetical protein